MGVQEVRWDKGGKVRTGDYNCLSVEKKRKPFVNMIFVHYRIVSAFKRVEFVSNRVSYSSERSLV